MRTFPFVRLPGPKQLPAAVGYAARFRLKNGTEAFVMASSVNALDQACKLFGLELDMLGAEKVIMTSANILEP